MIIKLCLFSSYPSSTTTLLWNKVCKVSLNRLMNLHLIKELLCRNYENYNEVRRKRILGGWTIQNKYNLLCFILMILGNGLQFLLFGILYKKNLNSEWTFNSFFVTVMILFPGEQTRKIEMRMICPPTSTERPL